MLDALLEESSNLCSDKRCWRNHLWLLFLGDIECQDKRTERQFQRQIAKQTADQHIHDLDRWLRFVETFFFFSESELTGTSERIAEEEKFHKFYD